MDGIVKQAAKRAQDDVRASAGKLKQEPLEFLNTAKSQIVQHEGARSPVVDQIVTRDGVVDEVSAAEKLEFEARTRKRLKELEEELEKIRQERKMKEGEWEKGVSAQMSAEKGENGDKGSLVQPSTKQRRGFLGSLKKKQGTREMGKTLSG